MADDVTILHRDDLEAMDGSGSCRWMLARRGLGVESFGMNVVEIGPGGELPEHDERERDQEEVFILLDGRGKLVADGTEHEARAGTMARVSPGVSRTVRNDGDAPLTVLIVSAPTTSGFQPMEWA